MIITPACRVRWTKWMAARILGTALRGAPTVAAAAVAVSALAGCTFGDGPSAQTDGGNSLDPNCVPVECLFECCQGWNWKPEPRLRGGNLPEHQCEEVRMKNATYAEYVVLMQDTQNYCTQDFTFFESGYCEVVNPPDVVKEFGHAVYAGLSFPVCPPHGLPAAYPVEDVALLPQE